jgi:hypothetical protein
MGIPAYLSKLYAGKNVRVYFFGCLKDTSTQTDDQQLISLVKVEIFSHSINLTNRNASFSSC